MACSETEPPEQETLRRWEREQAQLKANVIEEDTEEWQKDSTFAGLERVGGVDLSYVKGNDTVACASLVVLSYPDLEVLYEDCQMVTVSAPYVAGYLAFREAPFLVEAAQRLQEREPGLRPQVLLVDGNGVLHHRDPRPANGRRRIPSEGHLRESPGHGPAQLQEEHEAHLRLRGPQDVPGVGGAPRPVLLLTSDPESTSGSTCPPHWGAHLLGQGGRKRLSPSINLAPGRHCPAPV
ncbi:endonuclease V isoform X3 [Mauremys mutica]|uniref:endonuclease V isoform X3 n=1 Tax=Mauremys mutica TaxID=74926 RepID=UPI001D16BD54|nr:endonuclease V isoform X3 [Mauremys mutica]